MSLWGKSIWSATLAPALHLYNEYNGFFFSFSRRKEPAKFFFNFFILQEMRGSVFRILNARLPFLIFFPFVRCLYFRQSFSFRLFNYFFARPAKDKSRRKRNLWSDLLDVADRRDRNVSRCTNWKKGRIRMVEENGVFCSFTARSMLKRERGASHDSLSW